MTGLHRRSSSCGTKALCTARWFQHIEDGVHSTNEHRPCHRIEHEERAEQSRANEERCRDGDEDSE